MRRTARFNDVLSIAIAVLRLAFERAFQRLPQATCAMLAQAPATHPSSRSYIFKSKCLIYPKRKGPIQALNQNRYVI